MATHHTSTPHHVDTSPTHHETPNAHPAHESHAPAGGHNGGGYGVHTESLGTMEGHLGRTKDKVHAVGQTVAGANFGAKSMGVVGAGMTGTLNGTVSAAKEHVARAGKAVEDAGARTKAVREHYETTEANNAATIAGAGKPVDAPKTAAAGGGDNPPPPGSNPPPRPPDDGGGMHNNQGHHASDDELRGQYTRESMQTRPTSTDNQIRDAASRLGYDPDQHLAMTLKPTADLTPDQRAEIVAVRNELKANPGEIMTKVVKPEIGEATLGNETTYVDRHTGKTETNYPTSVAGSIARGSDTSQYGTPGEFRDTLALDDQGAGWTPIKAGANEAYQLRFPALDDRQAMEISYGGTDPGSAHDMQVASGQANPREWKPPFLGTGYTGGGVPEWLHAPRGYAGRGEMWLVRADGTEVLAGVYLEKRGWFDVRGRGGSDA
ncbi:hypothetical protein ACIRSS_32480 [Amycolatopsis sp. NPDC101161]|uniref:hypothetical protein n=1 Tax=Amycolatopsis sp. NPDC101161 TaxID=3363940 RepID=UPI00382C633B